MELTMTPEPTGEGDSTSYSPVAEYDAPKNPEVTLEHLEPDLLSS